MTEKKKARRSAQVIAAEIASKQRERHDAGAELEMLRTARLAMLRGTDEELEAHDRRMAKASRTVERAEAAAADLAEELAKAQAVEADAVRHAAYDKSRAAFDEYRRLAQEEYATLARQLSEVLHKMEEQSEIAMACNDDLPAGSMALYPEAFRAAPPEDERPALVEMEYWRDPDGLRSTAPMVVNGKSAPGFTRHTEMVPDPSWRPPTYHSRPSLPEAVVLPSVAHDKPPFWDRTP